MTNLTDELWVSSPDDIERMRTWFRQDASTAIERIASKFSAVSEHDFDSFLYEFDANLVGEASRGSGCAIFAIEPDFKAIYGFEPVYFGKFDRRLYSAFIERSLGVSIADKLSLNVESIAWFSLDQDWFAFGSRSSERVRCWSR